MKTKRIVMILAAVLCLGLLSACGAGKKGDDTFTVGFDAEFPPYGYIDDNGEFDGFDLALAAEACKRLGWELKLQDIVWDSKDAELASGNIDCIWNGFTRSPEREGQYAWTDAYVDNSQVFVVRADSGINAAADLSGKTVMVQAGSSALSALEDADNAALKATFGRFLECADYNSGFMELESGAIDALGMDIGVAIYQTLARTGNFIILNDPIAKEVYAVGFALNDNGRKDAINKTLKEMADDGTMLEIAKKYEDKGLVLDSLCMIK